MSLIQIISLAGSLFFLFLVLYAVYRSWLKEAYALICIFVSVGMILLSCPIRILEFIAGLMGIQTPAFALLLCLLGGILLMLFQCTVVISLQQQKIGRLTQEVTLLRGEVDGIQRTDQTHAE